MLSCRRSRVAVGLPAWGGAQTQPAAAQDQETGIRGMTVPAVASGSVGIPELGLSTDIAQGYFEFSDIALSSDIVLVSLRVEVDGFRSITQAHSIVLAVGTTPVLTVVLTPGNEPLVTDPCPGLLSTPQAELTAPSQLHASLCAQLPRVGTGGDLSRERKDVVVTLLALLVVGGIVLLAASSVVHRPKPRS